MPQIEQAANQLIAAYNKAETMFADAQAGDPKQVGTAFARIIGALQGEITMAIIHLGKYDSFQAECRRESMDVVLAPVSADGAEVTN